MFFVNWLGSHSKQEKKSQEQAELVMTLEEENTQLKSRIDELLTTESEADSSFGEENMDRLHLTGQIHRGLYNRT
jgi:3-phenylpropionate/cinnamic acid dioxygenase small subunit